MGCLFTARALHFFIGTAVLATKGTPMVIGVITDVVVASTTWIVWFAVSHAYSSSVGLQPESQHREFMRHHCRRKNVVAGVGMCLISVKAPPQVTVPVVRLGRLLCFWKLSIDVKWSVACGLPVLACMSLIFNLSLLHIGALLLAPVLHLIHRAERDDDLSFDSILRELQEVHEAGGRLRRLRETGLLHVVRSYAGTGDTKTRDCDKCNVSSSINLHRENALKLSCGGASADVSSSDSGSGSA